MNKKRLIIISLLCLLLGLAVGVTVYTLNKKPDMTAKQLVIKLQESNIPIDNVIVYNEQTDENKLLGRPNQYVSKINFADTRLDQFDDASPNGGTIEVFNNSSDLKRRKADNERVSYIY